MASEGSKLQEQFYNEGSTIRWIENEIVYDRWWDGVKMTSVLYGCRSEFALCFQ